MLMAISDLFRNFALGWFRFSLIDDIPWGWLARRAIFWSIYLAVLAVGYLLATDIAYYISIILVIGIQVVLFIADLIIGLTDFGLILMLFDISLSDIFAQVSDQAITLGSLVLPIYASHKYGWHRWWYTQLSRVPSAETWGRGYAMPILSSVCLGSFAIIYALNLRHVESETFELALGATLLLGFAALWFTKARLAAQVALVASLTGLFVLPYLFQGTPAFANPALLASGVRQTLTTHQKLENTPAKAIPVAFGGVKVRGPKETAGKKGELIPEFAAFKRGKEGKSVWRGGLTAWPKGGLAVEKVSAGARKAVEMTAKAAKTVGKATVNVARALKSPSVKADTAFKVSQAEAAQAIRKALPLPRPGGPRYSAEGKLIGRYETAKEMREYKSLIKAHNAETKPGPKQGHHSDVKSMGGDPAQILTFMRTPTHSLLHRDMAQFLKMRGIEIGGKSREDLLRDYGRDRLLKAQADFYVSTQPNGGARYSQVAKDFFAQNPGELGSATARAKAESNFLSKGKPQDHRARLKELYKVK